MMWVRRHAPRGLDSAAISSLKQHLTPSLPQRCHSILFLVHLFDSESNGSFDAFIFAGDLTVALLINQSSVSADIHNHVLRALESSKQLLSLSLSCRVVRLQQHGPLHHAVEVLYTSSRMAMITLDSICSSAPAAALDVLLNTSIFLLPS